jgi:ferredoxin
MADPNRRFADNITGASYVDENCISCDTCAGFAPLNFKLTDDHDHAIVFQQPKTSLDKQQCEKAKQACPVQAIGNDG